MLISLIAAAVMSFGIGLPARDETVSMERHIVSDAPTPTRSRRSGPNWLKACLAR